MSRVGKIIEFGGLVPRFVERNPDYCEYNDILLYLVDLGQPSLAPDAALLSNLFRADIKTRSGVGNGRGFLGVSVVFMTTSMVGTSVTAAVAV